MKKVKLENGKFVEIASCKVREFPRVYEKTVEFFQAETEDDALAVAKAICDAWAPTLDPEDLTTDDLWNILLAKAGMKRGILETVSDLIIQGMKDFFAEDGAGKELMKKAMQETMQD